MPEGIDRDGGGIDMHPDQAKAAITGLDQAAVACGDQITRRINDIAGLDSQLGTDLFGASFAMQYQPFVDELVPQVHELNLSVRDFANNGQLCAAEYVRQDQENRSTVQGSGQ